MTINYFINSKKRKLANIYVRVFVKEKSDLIVKSGLYVDPSKWSIETQSIKQRIRTDDEDILVKKLANLKTTIEDEFKKRFDDHSKDWLLSVIRQFHTKRKKTKGLNDYIDRFVTDAKSGARKNAAALNLAPGTIRIIEGFKRIFGEYQGIYTDKRIEWHTKNEKALRPKRIIDFEDITIDFYNSFVNYLSDEGYALNTQGRLVKWLKIIMRKALQEKFHNNREFEYDAFRGISENTFAVYLTLSEIESIYKYDLSGYPRMELARDAWVILCETTVRVSDYSKIDINIRVINDKKFIDITQTKTGAQVIIPLTQRFEEIWNRYKGLPKIPEQYINEHIKTVAKWCNINEELHWETIKYGKKYQRTAYKWELITCHTGRRSGCTNMFLSGIPPLDIMKISGHKSEKEFLKYIKITKEQSALKLSQHPYFNTLKIV